MFKVHAIPPGRLPELLRAMTKAELHIHIEGSLESERILSLTKRNDVQLPYVNLANNLLCNFLEVRSQQFVGFTLLKSTPQQSMPIHYPLRIFNLDVESP